MGIPANHPAVLEAIKRGLVSEPGVKMGKVVARQRADRVTVPPPPSTNNLFVSLRGGKRVKSKTYLAWLGEVVPLLRTLEKPRSFPAGFRAAVLGTINAARDLDNFMKPLLDACVEAGVIADDRLQFVGSVLVEHFPDGGEGRVVVWFESPGGEETHG